MAKINAYHNWYGCREKVEKYRVVNDGNEWSLYHYDTLTATVKNGIGKVIWGQSRSDLDSIQTFLVELTGKAPEMHYYPSKDAFQVLEDGKVVQSF